jgi:hypothetical protein
MLSWGGISDQIENASSLAEDLSFLPFGLESPFDMCYWVRRPQLRERSAKCLMVWKNHWSRMNPSHHIGLLGWARVYICIDVVDFLKSSRTDPTIVVSTLVWLWWVIDLSLFEFKSGIFQLFYLIICSCGESCLLVSCCVGVRCDMVDSNKDLGRSSRPGTEDQGWSSTDRILDGRTIGRSGDAMCGLHRAQED